MQSFPIACAACLLLISSSHAQSQTTNCTSQVAGNTTYTTCQKNQSLQSGNFASVQYDPNAFTKGAQQAQEFAQIRGRNMAGSALAHNNPEQAIKYLYEAGLIEEAQALEDRIALKQQQTTSRQAATKNSKPIIVDGVLYTPYQP
jgi:hypothetical protein